MAIIDSFLRHKNIVENPDAELAKSNRHLNLRFRPDIEGLRAVAIGFVVLYHAGLPFLPGGFIGVDLFFVLSGYLITSLLIKELDSSGEINLLRFYARRVRRLLPASTLVVVITCLLEVIIASPMAQMEVLKAALTTTLYASNLYFAHIQLNYFLRSLAPSPLLHTWSLAVEEQFYFVWPIFLLLLSRAVKSVRIRIVVIVGITILSFIGCVWLSSVNQVTAFFQPLPRAWEFSLGGLLALVPAHWLNAHENLCKRLGIAGLITLLLCGALVTNSATFPGYIVAIPVLATLATLQAGVGAPSSPAARLLSWRPLQYLGKISYSLYLWHWPVLMIAPQVFPSNSAAVRTGCVALSVLLAAITHVAVENPVRFNSLLVPRPLLTLGIVGLSLMISIGGFAVWWAALNHSAQFRKFTTARNDVPSFYGKGCVADLNDAHVKLCSFGEISNPELTVVLFGDSHAAQWFPAMKNIAESRHWKLVTVIKSACSPMNIRASRDAGAIEACARWRKRATAAIAEMHPDMVVMSSSSLYPRRDSSKLIDAAEWERGSRDIFIAIAGSGTALRVIRDTPHADYDIPSCLAQLAWNGHASCPPMIRESALNSDIYEAQMRAAANIANVRFIDMSDAICGRDSCQTEQGDTIKYRDRDHMTSSYAASLANALQAQLFRSLQ